MDTNKEDQKIKFADRTTVYVTEKGGKAKGAHNAGDEITVHPVQAAALIKSGKATAAGPEDGGTGTKTKKKAQTN